MAVNETRAVSVTPGGVACRRLSFLPADCDLAPGNIIIPEPVALSTVTGTPLARSDVAVMLCKPADTELGAPAEEAVLADRRHRCT